MNLRLIRSELARLAGGRGFTLYDTVPGDLEPPAIVIGWPSSVRFVGNLAGGAEVTLPLTVVFGRADDDVAQERLDAVLSGPLADDLATATSPAWVYLDVVEARNIGTSTAGGLEVLTAELVLQIVTT